MELSATTATLLENAADLRAQGLAWDVIARTLGRTGRRLRMLRQAHAELWASLLARAEKEYLSNAAAESVSILRSQLRDKDKDTVQKAALSLLKHDVSRRPPQSRRETEKRTASAEAIRMAEYVEGLSDAEIDAILDEMDRAPSAEPEVPELPELPVDAAPAAEPAEGPDLPECVS